MTAERYELRADHTDWLDVRDPQGYRNTINQPGAIALIRQQARDIAGWDRLFTAVVSQSLPNAPSLWPFDGEQGPAMVAFAIHQLRADLAAAVAEKNSAIARLGGFPNLDAMRECMIASADENADLRRELAAAVAERDEARTAYQVRSTEWHQHELIALALAERYKLRAEQAEARLAVIDSAPVVHCAWVVINGVNTYAQLIARPAKD